MDLPLVPDRGWTPGGDVLVGENVQAVDPIMMADYTDERIQVVPASPSVDRPRWFKSFSFRRQKKTSTSARNGVASDNKKITRSHSCRTIILQQPQQQHHPKQTRESRTSLPPNFQPGDRLESAPALKIMANHRNPTRTYSNSSSSSNSSLNMLRKTIMTPNESKPGATFCSSHDAIVAKMTAWDRLHGETIDLDASCGCNNEANNKPGARFCPINSGGTTTTNNNNNNCNHVNKPSDKKPAWTQAETALSKLMAAGAPPPPPLPTPEEDTEFSYDSAQLEEDPDDDYGKSGDGASFYPSSSYEHEVLDAKAEASQMVGNPVATSPRDRQDTQLEIAPGLFARLRGAQETWHAVKNDFYIPMTVFCCENEWLCIMDANYVLCPTCRVVSPVSTTATGIEQGDGKNDEHNGDGGVGMGFSWQDLQEMQLQILQEQRSGLPPPSSASPSSSGW